MPLPTGKNVLVMMGAMCGSWGWGGRGGSVVVSKIRDAGDDLVAIL